MKIRKPKWKQGEKLRRVKIRAEETRLAGRAAEAIVKAGSRWECWEREEERDAVRTANETSRA